MFFAPPSPVHQPHVAARDSWRRHFGQFPVKLCKTHDDDHDDDNDDDDDGAPQPCW